MSFGPPVSLDMLSIYKNMPLCAHMDDEQVSCLAAVSPWQKLTKNWANGGEEQSGNSELLKSLRINALLSPVRARIRIYRAKCTLLQKSFFAIFLNLILQCEPKQTKFLNLFGSTEKLHQIRGVQLRHLHSCCEKIMGFFKLRRFLSSLVARLHKNHEFPSSIWCHFSIVVYLHNRPLQNKNTQICDISVFRWNHPRDRGKQLILWSVNSCNSWRVHFFPLTFSVKKSATKHCWLWSIWNLLKYQCACLHHITEFKLILAFYLLQL